MGIEEDEEFLPDILSNHSDDGDQSENDEGIDQQLRKKNRKKTEKKYCFCRSSRTDQFMIQCDKCKEWFHGDCVKITQAQARRIADYYCFICVSTMRKNDQNNQNHQSTFGGPSSSNTANILFENSFEKRIDDDYSPEDYDEDDEDEEFRLLKAKIEDKRRYKKNVSKGKTKKSNQKTQKRGRKKGQSTKAKENRGRGRKKNVDKKSHQHRHGRSKAHSDESTDETKSSSPRHCYGPGCIHTARKGSKYCSDQCGLNMADKRIMLILPQKIKEWQSVPTAADERSRRELEEIEQEIIRTDDTMNEILRKKIELNQLIMRGKSCIPYTEEECTAILESEVDTANDTISCVTCAQEVSVKIALKHMERCFNKIESQTSFGSSRNTNNSLFCEAYNPGNKTYCKRLRVICPEHTKEPRIADDEICGCPLRSENNPFKDVADSFCRLLRKKCNIHYGWEKIRLAVLDAELLEQMFKMDELINRKNKIRQAMNNRGGLVQLLLHQTKYERIDESIEVNID